MFIYLFKQKRISNIPAPTLLTISLMLTVAISFHGLFSISYNTVAQIIWILFIFNFFYWHKHSYKTIAFYPSLISIVHPPSAISMTLISLIRILFDNEKKIYSSLIFFKNLFLVSFIIFIIILFFSSIEKIYSSYNFSSSYGVGSILHLNIKEFYILIYIVASLLGPIILRNLISKKLIYLLIVLCLVFGELLLLSVYFFDENSSRRFYLVYITPPLVGLLFAYLFNEQKKLKSSQSLIWLLLVFLLHLTTIVITSSNGVFQSHGATMVIIPLLLLLYHDIFQSKNSISFVLLLSSVLFLTQWSIYSYRDDSKLSASEFINHPIELKGIYSTKEKISIINTVKKEFPNQFVDKNVLISGSWPAMYYILNAKPSTCMNYMHSLPSEAAFNEYIACINLKPIDYFIDIKSEDSVSIPGNFLDKFNNQIIEKRKFKCIYKDLEVENFRSKYLKFQICSKASDESMFALPVN